MASNFNSIIWSFVVATPTIPIVLLREWPPPTRWEETLKSISLLQCPPRDLSRMIKKWIITRLLVKQVESRTTMCFKTLKISIRLQGTVRKGRQSEVVIAWWSTEKKGWLILYPVLLTMDSSRKVNSRPYSKSIGLKEWVRALTIWLSRPKNKINQICSNQSSS